MKIIVWISDPANENQDSGLINWQVILANSMPSVRYFSGELWTIARIASTIVFSPQLRRFARWLPTEYNLQYVWEVFLRCTYFACMFYHRCRGCSLYYRNSYCDFCASCYTSSSMHLWFRSLVLLLPKER